MSLGVGAGVPRVEPRTETAADEARTRVGGDAEQAAGATTEEDARRTGAETSAAARYPVRGLRSGLRVWISTRNRVEVVALHRAVPASQAELRERQSRVCGHQEVPRQLRGGRDGLQWSRMSRRHPHAAGDSLLKQLVQ